VAIPISTNVTTDKKPPNLIGSRSATLPITRIRATPAQQLATTVVSNRPARRLQISLRLHSHAMRAIQSPANASVKPMPEIIAFALVELP